MFRQINEYMDLFLSRHQCGFRKGYSTQQCILSMLEKRRSAVDNRNTFGALQTDLSKAFDCLWHELLLEKLHAYGFSIPGLKLVYSYSKNRKRRTKIKNKILCTALGKKSYLECHKDLFKGLCFLTYFYMTYFT